MSRMVALGPLVLLFLLPAFGDEPKPKERPAAADLLSVGLAQAKNQGKRVFLLFGSPG